MPWIHQVPVDEATGILKEEFDMALERADRVWNIVHIMSQNPGTLRASMGSYQAIMHEDSPLTRMQREMLATVVSAELACPY